MRRKIFTLIMTVCLIISPVNILADGILWDLPRIDNFTLHSGTKFGDTVSVVKEKEMNAGFTVSDDEPPFGFKTKSVSLKGMFAGISDSELSYSFNREGPYSPHYLYMEQYIFGRNNENNPDSQDDDFDTITETLIKKYGNPFYSDGDEKPFYNSEKGLGQGFSNYDYYKAYYGADIESFSCNQWLVKTEDYYVLIDHYLIGINYEKGYHGFHSLTYERLDEGTVIETLEPNDRLQQEKADSLENDL